MLKSSHRVASRFMLAFEPGMKESHPPSPQEDGWNPGEVVDFQPTEGTGSQVPPARDNQGKEIPAPKLPPVSIPGVDKTATRKEWAGTDVRSIAERVESWWDDFEQLIRGYWSLSSDLKIVRSKNKMVFRVNHLGPMTVEIIGPPTKLKVYVGGAERTFGPDANLFDILMWIEGVPRNQFR